MAMPSLRPSRLRLVGGTAAEEAPEEIREGSRSHDAELVARTRQGDSRAFEVLYRRHAGFALNLAVRIQGNAGDVEDVVHEAVRLRVRASQSRAERAMRGLGVRARAIPRRAKASPPESS